MVSEDTSRPASLCAWDPNPVLVLFGYTKVRSVLYHMLPLTSHFSAMCFFGCQTFLCVTLWKLPGTPGTHPAARVVPRHHPEAERLPLNEVSVQVADVSLGPVPGISGLQGGMFARLWGHMDANPRGWTDALTTVAGVSATPRAPEVSIWGRHWAPFSLCPCS